MSRRGRILVLFLCWLSYRYGYQRALEQRAWPTFVGGPCYTFEGEPRSDWRPVPIPEQHEFSQGTWRVL